MLELGTSVTEWAQYSLIVNRGVAATSTIYETFPEDVARGFLGREVGKATVTNGLAPDQVNNDLQYSVRGSGLEMNTAETIFKSESTPDQARTKQLGFDAVTVGTTGTWVPIAAGRQTPEKQNITGSLVDMTITNFSESGTSKVIVKDFHPSKVTFDGTGSWEYPPELIPSETTVQVRNDVSQFADSTGTMVSSTDNPGGNLVARSTNESTKDASLSFGTVTDGRFRNFFISQDISVVMANVDNTGDVSLEFNYTEDW